MIGNTTVLQSLIMYVLAHYKISSVNILISLFNCGYMIMCFSQNQKNMSDSEPQITIGDEGMTATVVLPRVIIKNTHKRGNYICLKTSLKRITAMAFSMKLL